MNLDPSKTRLVQRVLVTVASVPAWFFPHYRTSTITSTLISKLVRSGSMATATVLPSGEQFAFPADDPYWMRVLSPFYAYERDVAFALRTSSRLGFHGLVDGGANFGFLSVAFADRFDWIHSIEATSETAELLATNVVKLPRVTMHHRAIWDTDGETVSIDYEAGQHASAHVDESQSRPEGNNVETLTVDGLLDTQPDADLGRVVVKLDVEGAERRAMVGAAKAISGGAVFLLEDHGKDPECVSYQAAQDLFAHPRVALLTHGGAIEIENRDHLLKLKKHSGVGYNIVVTEASSNLGAQLIDELTARRKETVQERIWSATERLGWGSLDRLVSSKG